ncbi:hypothetical protein V8C35DRAFT_317144 [Trichoderma chlorosporum]
MTLPRKSQSPILCKRTGTRFADQRTPAAEYRRTRTTKLTGWALLTGVAAVFGGLHFDLIDPSIKHWFFFFSHHLSCLAKVYLSAEEMARPPIDRMCNRVIWHVRLRDMHETLQLRLQHARSQAPRSRCQQGSGSCCAAGRAQTSKTIAVEVCSPEKGQKRETRWEKNFQFSCMSAHERGLFAKLGFGLFERVGMADLGSLGDRRLPAANGRPESGAAQPHTLPRSGLLHASSAGTRGRELSKKEKIRFVSA